MELDCLHGVPLLEAAAHQVPREALLLQQSAPPHNYTLELSTIFRDVSMTPHLTSLNWLSASLQSASVQRASRQQLGWPGWMQDTPTPSIASAVS